jgi:uncharacterized protein YyaL (SSP411 family)
MSVFLTPSLAPFFGGTYFPATESSHGSPSFMQVLNQLGNIWSSDPAKILGSASDIVDLLKKNSTSSTPALVGPGSAVISSAADKMSTWMEQGFDAKWGGFGRAPKFPTPPQLVFLAKAVARGPVLQSLLDDENVDKLKALATRLACSEADLEESIGSRVETSESGIEWLRFTLAKITQGGIHDHVGAGFHRYSVDNEWHVPHFEKMLYDQGQLMSLFAVAHVLTGSEGEAAESDFARVAEDILAYLTRNLTSPKGGFYCAEDADSLPTLDSTKKREGAFAVWTEKEVREALVKTVGMTAKELEVFEYYFDVKSGGNVRPGPTDPHGELKGVNVLRVLHTVAGVAKKFSMNENEVRKVVERGKEELRKIRATRPPPLLDDKILVAWNGLAISGLATSHTLLKPTDSTSDFLTKAMGAADFIRANMFDEKSGQLRRVYRDDGPGAARGVAEDYAFLIQGLLDLYEALVVSGAEAGFANGYLSFAADLQDYLDGNFWDEVGYGYFTGAKNPDPERKPGEADDFVLLRTKEEHDGAEPAASSIALSNLLRLEGMIPGRAKGTGYGERAEKIVAAFAPQVGKYPQTMPALVGTIEDWRFGIEHVGWASESISCHHFC